MYGLVASALRLRPIGAGAGGGVAPLPPDKRRLKKNGYPSYMIIRPLRVQRPCLVVRGSWRCSVALAFGGPPALAHCCPRRLCVRAFGGEFVCLVVFLVSVVFVCGSSGVAVVSSRSGRRLGGSAVVCACRARVRVWLGGAWVRSWRVRGSLARVRAVLRGSRLAAASRVVRGSGAGAFLARVPVRSFVACARFGVLARLARVRAVACGVPPLFRFSRVVPSLVSLSWSGLPPRVAGRVGCASRGGRLWAWVLCPLFVAGVRSGAVWLVSAVPAGLAPVVLVLRSGGSRSGGSVWSASGAGSVLWLSSPAVVSAVRSGACPLSLALRVFRWPVRSAVLWSLCGALASLRVSVGGWAGVPRGLLASFVRAALRALGWRFSAVRSVPWRVRGAFRGSAVASFLSVRAVAWPSLVSAWGGSASWSVSAVVSALRSLVRCLSWLSARSGGRVSCPPALRGVLASVAGVALARLAG